LNRIKDFFTWYKNLTKHGYGRIMSIEMAWYNSKHYDSDGNYK